MTTRKCQKCRIEKPLTLEFFRHSNGIRHKGFQYMCKDCNNGEGNARYYRTKEKVKKLTAKWQQENPEKKKAHEIVHKAIKNGTLVKKPCEECGNPKVHGHHEDYTKPLEVIWLCAKHHRLLHYYLDNNKKV